ncbi:MAG TPA: hypothetical protein VII47_13185 [Actinomycetota bacterium]
MVMRRRSGWVALVGGSIGIGLIVAGGIVFLEEVLYWLRERDWETVTLRWLFVDRRGNPSIPLLSWWLQHSRSGWHDVIIQLLDMTPLWLFLMVLGGWLAFRAARVRR